MWWRNLTIVLVTCFTLIGPSEAKIYRSPHAIAEFKRIQPCPTNGNRYGPCPGYQIDHVTPLKCKGDDAPVNMQWLTVEEHKAKTKREARWCAHNNARTAQPIPQQATPTQSNRHQ